MDTQMDHGLSSADHQILRVTPYVYEEWEPIIAQLLDDQPASYEPLQSKEDVLNAVKYGAYVCWVYMIDHEVMGMVLYDHHNYGDDTKTVMIRFLSCRNFHKMTKLLPHLEALAEQHGYDYIEAVAHPTIAQYGVNKAGFVAPGVYIRKTLAKHRRN